ncbi:hypothetical protein LTR78_004990 [Recurvomyces mirabilis]|uniref:Uncharacterized protein n=1 Tax=Recurvomyces mirabilis TaxID=574656 RepID=A0AAE0WNV0_9PEZI|nr:hypothetical protein LTR78_004990 [Recurvomyces mirabilis]KAK5158394.1 hypothetical protein LTS14_003412 [Recurvomyces mirabilis]
MTSSIYSPERNPERESGDSDAHVWTANSATISPPSKGRAVDAAKMYGAEIKMPTAQASVASFTTAAETKAGVMFHGDSNPYTIAGVPDVEPGEIKMEDHTSRSSTPRASIDDVDRLVHFRQRDPDASLVAQLPSRQPSFRSRSEGFEPAPLANAPHTTSAAADTGYLSRSASTKSSIGAHGRANTANQRISYPIPQEGSDDPQLLSDPRFQDAYISNPALSRAPQARRHGFRQRFGPAREHGLARSESQKSQLSFTEALQLPRQGQEDVDVSGSAGRPVVLGEGLVGADDGKGEKVYIPGSHPFETIPLSSPTKISNPVHNSNWSSTGGSNTSPSANNISTFFTTLNNNTVNDPSSQKPNKEKTWMGSAMIEPKWRSNQSKSRICRYICMTVVALAIVSAAIIGLGTYAYKQHVDAEQHKASHSSVSTPSTSATVSSQTSSPMVVPTTTLTPSITIPLASATSSLPTTAPAPTTLVTVTVQAAPTAISTSDTSVTPVTHTIEPAKKSFFARLNVFARGPFYQPVGGGSPSGTDAGTGAGSSTNSSLPANHGGISRHSTPGGDQDPPYPDSSPEYPPAAEDPISSNPMEGSAGPPPIDPNQGSTKSRKPSFGVLSSTTTAPIDDPYSQGSGTGDPNDSLGGATGTGQQSGKNSYAGTTGTGPNGDKNAYNDPTQDEDPYSGDGQEAGSKPASKYGDAGDGGLGGNGYDDPTDKSASDDDYGPNNDYDPTGMDQKYGGQSGPQGLAGQDSTGSLNPYGKPSSGTHNPASSLGSDQYDPAANGLGGGAGDDKYSAGGAGSDSLGANSAGQYAQGNDNSGLGGLNGASQKSSQLPDYGEEGGSRLPNGPGVSSGPGSEPHPVSSVTVSGSGGGSSRSKTSQKSSSDGSVGTGSTDPNSKKRNIPRQAPGGGSGSSYSSSSASNAGGASAAGSVNSASQDTASAGSDPNSLAGGSSGSKHKASSGSSSMSNPMSGAAGDDESSASSDLGSSDPQTGSSGTSPATDKAYSGGASSKPPMSGAGSSGGQGSSQQGYGQGGDQSFGQGSNGQGFGLNPDGIYGGAGQTDLFSDSDDGFSGGSSQGGTSGLGGYSGGSDGGMDGKNAQGGDGLGGDADPGEGSSDPGEGGYDTNGEGGNPYTPGGSSDPYNSGGTGTPSPYSKSTTSQRSYYGDNSLPGGGAGDNSYGGGSSGDDELGVGGGGSDGSFGGNAGGAGSNNGMGPNSQAPPKSSKSYGTNPAGSLPSSSASSAGGADGAGSASPGADSQGSDSFGSTPGGDGSARSSKPQPDSRTSSGAT